MNNVSIIDQNAFDAAVLSADRPLLVKFGAPWCGPCRRIAPQVEAVARQFDGGARVVAVDVDQSPELTARLNIEHLPALLIFKAGRVVGEMRGFATAKRIADALEEHL